MNPIAILRHAAVEGPGFLAGFLDARNIPWQLIAIDEEDAIPRSAQGFSGLIFMGGPMSVNDDLPWIAQELALIRDAVARDIPVLGHCLGGQLISKSLGGIVAQNPVKEIGWGQVVVADNSTARTWFSGIQYFDAFHWHGETFTLPQGAVHLLSSEHCVNQAYAIGPHLALQCHIEMTETMIADWCVAGAVELSACAASPAVQTAQFIGQQMAQKIAPLHEVAERLYTRWLAGVQR
ncbi:MAG: glutamine amidotransferase [Gallionellales bacterium RIFOXYB12_FULL_54_9]|nr:MAG: glutamine amidotransferase [Gallionellales bacterium RIFOXYB12_FULL_54_9]